MASLQQQRQEQNYFVRLGSLSERLRNHAYEHSQETLQQLTSVLGLVSLPVWVWPWLGPPSCSSALK